MRRVDGEGREHGKKLVGEAGLEPGQVVPRKRVRPDDRDSGLAKLLPQPAPAALLFRQQHAGLVRDR